MQWIARQGPAVRTLVSYYVALLSVSDEPVAFESIKDEERAEHLAYARKWFDEMLAKWGGDPEDLAVSCIASLRAQSPLFRMISDEAPDLRSVLQ